MVQLAESKTTVNLDHVTRWPSSNGDNTYTMSYTYRVGDGVEYIRGSRRFPGPYDDDQLPLFNTTLDPSADISQQELDAKIERSRYFANTSRQQANFITIGMGTLGVSGAGLEAWIAVDRAPKDGSLDSHDVAVGSLGSALTLSIAAVAMVVLRRKSNQDAREAKASVERLQKIHDHLGFGSTTLTDE